MNGEQFHGGEGNLDTVTVWSDDASLLPHGQVCQVPVLKVVLYPDIIDVLLDKSIGFIIESLCNEL